VHDRHHPINPHAPWEPALLAPTAFLRRQQAAGPGFSRDAMRSPLLVFLAWALPLHWPGLVPTCYNRGKQARWAGEGFSTRRQMGWSRAPRALRRTRHGLAGPLRFRDGRCRHGFVGARAATLLSISHPSLMSTTSLLACRPAPLPHRHWLPYLFADPRFSWPAGVFPATSLVSYLHCS